MENVGRSVLVADFAGHAFPFDLSRELSARGWKVTHTYCSDVESPRSSFAQPGAVVIRPVVLGRPFERFSLVRRLRDECRYGFGTVRVLRSSGSRTVLASNMPVVSLLVIWTYAILTRRRRVLWLQDVQSGLAGMVAGRGSVVARVLSALETLAVRTSSEVVGISDGITEEAIRRGAGRALTIENWACLDELPLRERANAWAQQHGLVDRFVFLYSGTLGMKHSPEVVISLAELFESDPEVVIVVVAAGQGAESIDRALAERPRHNVLRLPLQEFSALPDVLASSDVLLVLLDPLAAKFCVPSKVLSYLCAARPILAVVPASNPVAELVQDRAAAGLLADPANIAELKASAQRLRDDHGARSALGASARRYAEVAFELGPIADRFEEVLGSVGTRDQHR
ncbi:MAG: glycosyltransferase [Ilumatobacteraceae bacterium]